MCQLSFFPHSILSLPASLPSPSPSRTILPRSWFSFPPCPSRSHLFRVQTEVLCSSKLQSDQTFPSPALPCPTSRPVSLHFLETRRISACALGHDTTSPDISGPIQTSSLFTASLLCHKEYSLVIAVKSNQITLPSQTSISCQLASNSRPILRRHSSSFLILDQQDHSRRLNPVPRLRHSNTR